MLIMGLLLLFFPIKHSLAEERYVNQEEFNRITNLAIRSPLNQDLPKVARDAVFLARMDKKNGNDRDLARFYNIAVDYSGFEKIAHRFFDKASEWVSSDDRSVSRRVLELYLLNHSELSLTQKIKLADLSVLYNLDQKRVINLINYIWSTGFFEKNNLSWESFYSKYRSTIDEYSHFQQAKILLLSGGYARYEKLKELIKKKEWVDSLSMLEKIIKNRIVDKSIANLNHLDDATVYYIMENIKDKYNPDLYYKLALKAKCDSSGELSDMLWKSYKYSIYELIKSESLDGKKKAFEIASHCDIFRKESGARRNFLAGWIALEYLKDPELSIDFFTKMSDFGGYDTKSKSDYWLGRANEESGNFEIADMYYSKASENPFVFYGQLAAHELYVDIRKKINEDIRIIEDDAIRYEDQSSSMLNLLTYLSKMMYFFGNYKGARFYIKNAVELPVDRSLRAGAALRVFYKTEGDFYIPAGKLIKLNGVPMLNYSYIKHNDHKYSPIIKSVIFHESGFRSNVVSNKNAKGLMQIKDSTFNITLKRIGDKSIKNRYGSAGSNVYVGATHLQTLLNKYDNIALVLAGYNAGEGKLNNWIKHFGKPRKDDPRATINWIESITYDDTLDYVIKINEMFIVYSALVY